MSKFWPGPRGGGALGEDNHIHMVEHTIMMPPPEVQDHLIKVYFTYINPAVPVLDEESFMAQYNAQYVSFSYH